MQEKDSGFLSPDGIFRRGQCIGLDKRKKGH
jgi:hypothetical protein